MKTNFACMADAVAYYYQRGYKSIDQKHENGKYNSNRLMVNEDLAIIRITQTGLLSVTVKAI